MKTSTTSWLHPLSAAAVLIVDWIAWKIELLTFLLATPVTVLLSFVVVLSAVYQIQTHRADDPPPAARRKAILGALAAAVPFPITGTIVGGWVLALAGWRGMWKLLLKR